MTKVQAIIHCRLEPQPWVNTRASSLRVIVSITHSFTRTLDWLYPRSTSRIRKFPWLALSSARRDGMVSCLVGYGRTRPPLLPTYRATPREAGCGAWRSITSHVDKKKDCRWLLIAQSCPAAVIACGRQDRRCGFAFLLRRCNGESVRCRPWEGLRASQPASAYQRLGAFVRQRSDVDMADSGVPCIEFALITVDPCVGENQRRSMDVPPVYVYISK